MTTAATLRAREKNPKALTALKSFVGFSWLRDAVMIAAVTADIIVDTVDTFVMTSLSRF